MNQIWGMFVNKMIKKHTLVIFYEILSYSFIVFYRIQYWMISFIEQTFRCDDPLSEIKYCKNVIGHICFVGLNACFWFISSWITSKCIECSVWLYNYNMHLYYIIMVFSLPALLFFFLLATILMCHKKIAYT